MELFKNAKTVRLRSHHDKYLSAEDDGESVNQSRNGAARQARWTVERSDSGRTIRLKSCFGRYLTASNEPFLLGMTGCKVTQTLPAHSHDSSLEWEPVRDGFQLRFKTAYGRFLRANGGLPPWRNSVTHDIPHRTATQDWVLWELDVVEIIPVFSPPPSSSPVAAAAPPLSAASSFSEPSSPPRDSSPSLSRRESIASQSSDSSPPRFFRPESMPSQFSDSFSLKFPRQEASGRTVHYTIADDSGNVDESYEPQSLQFKGMNVQELTAQLEEETGLSDLIVCTRNPLNQKLHPLLLHLPPNNATMNVVLVSSSSKVARSFTKAPTLR